MADALLAIFLGIGASLGILAFIGVVAVDIRTNQDVARLWRNIVSNTSVWSERYWHLRVKVDGHEKDVARLTTVAIDQAHINDIWVKHLSDHTFVVVDEPPKRTRRKRISVKAPNVVRRKRRKHGRDV